MTFLRLLLYPFSLIYGLATILRNYLYDKNILRQNLFDMPIISVGNLSVGGTGKTP
ncbi:MAG: tetraacyldisaccharide 4'-kinase, partial [Bacteroidales bacterium]|nr:tetraacyldisaccharide 4'-kinase [Bacteroidales bacterium]